ncbi:MAG: acyl carrier protein [Methylobacter sp.]|jgi:acyl carrier protein
MINQNIKKVMGEVFGIDQASIGEDASPGNIEQWDSLRHMNLVVALEEEFEVRLPDESISEMVSFKLIEFHLCALLPTK